MVMVIDVQSSRDPAERKRRARERLHAISRLMDAAIEVPLLRTRVGLDALLGVVPVAGDLLSAAIGLYLVAPIRRSASTRPPRARPSPGAATAATSS